MHQAGNEVVPTGFSIELHPLYEGGSAVAHADDGHANLAHCSLPESWGPHRRVDDARQHVRYIVQIENSAVMRFEKIKRDAPHLRKHRHNMKGPTTNQGSAHE